MTQTLNTASITLHKLPQHQVPTMTHPQNDFIEEVSRNRIKSDREPSENDLTGPAPAAEDKTRATAQKTVFQTLTRLADGTEEGLSDAEREIARMLKEVSRLGKAVAAERSGAAEKSQIAHHPGDKRCQQLTFGRSSGGHVTGRREPSHGQ